MNALALPALALATRASSALPALFTDLPARSPDAAIIRLDSTGHTQDGKGAAQYISDALCDAALLSKHPNFVFNTANNRIFRLLPDNGRIAVEQGGASGDGIANDQPAVQATIDYAEAIAASEVVFGQAHYAVHCPIRNSDASNTHAVDGHPLVVSRSLILRGVAAKRTVLDFKAADGSDPETNWQSVPLSDGNPAQAVWRGGGLFLAGDVTYPAPVTRSIERLELHRLIFQGNRLHTGQYAYPADTGTGDGWDITDRAFWMQDCYVGEIVAHDFDCVGWKGEMFYLAGAVDAVERLELNRCRFVTGNASGFNPGVNVPLVARDCEFGDCFQAQEDTGKFSARYYGCVWRDCGHIGLGSGPTSETLYNYLYPTRDEAAALPMTVLDGCEFRNIDQVIIRSWTSGNVRTVDAGIAIDANQSMAAYDIDLTIDAWLDQANIITALTLTGVNDLTTQVPGAPAGTYKQPPQHIRAKIRHFRTALAEQEGRQWRAPYWTGYVGKACRLEIEGDFASQTTPNGGQSPISMPFVILHPGQPTTAYTTHAYFIANAYAANGEITPTGPVMAIGAASDVTLDMSLARWPVGGPDYGYYEGQKLRLAKNDAQGVIRFVKGSAPANFAVNETRALADAHDWIEFTYNVGIRRWEESGFFSAA